jgi:tetratricopeptide (TPR) repeat protein
LERPPFAAYQGNEPYVFVCYAHDDAPVVYAELRWLRDQGLNIWYDEGISPGAEWRDESARAIEEGALFLFFVSPNSVRSDDCRREVGFAVDAKRPMIAVHLERTELPRAMRLAIMERQAVFKYALSREDYERLLGSALNRLLQPQTNQSSRSRSRDEFDASRRVFVVVASDGTVEGTTVANSVARYMSWYGGAFRVSRRTGSQTTYPGDYLAEIGLVRAADRLRIDWHAQRYESGEIVGASRIEDSVAHIDDMYERLSETIAESLLRAITDREIEATAGRDVHGLSYGQLILQAGQLKYLEREKVAEREKRLALAVALEPDTGLAYAMQADLLSWKVINGVSMKDDRDLAHLDGVARRALVLAPNEPQVLLSVGTSYCRVGRYEQGLALLRRAMMLAPTARARDELARSLCFAGHPEDAIKLFEQILATMPAGHVFPYGRLAVALTQAVRLKDALVYSTEAITHFPTDYYGWLVHANLLALLDREREASAAVEEARRLVPKVRLETVIARTEASYGRSDTQKAHLTGGLKRLLNP